MEKKTRHSMHTQIPVDRDAYQEFKGLCVLQNIVPRTHLDALIKKWVEKEKNKLAAKQTGKAS